MKKWLIVFWIATWTAHWTEPGACPDTMKPEVTENPYTGQINWNPEGTNFAITRYCPHDIPRRKEFDTKEAADAFLDACPKGTCTDEKIEEVYL